jgi:hypothetical protein
MVRWFFNVSEFYLGCTALSPRYSCKSDLFDILVGAILRITKGHITSPSRAASDGRFSRIQNVKSLDR